MNQVKKIESQALDMTGEKKTAHLFVTEDGTEYGSFCSYPVCLLCVQDEAIQRVRELHKPYTDELSINGLTKEAYTYCLVCYEKRNSGSIFANDYALRIEYPCPTIKALDGEQ